MMRPSGPARFLVLLAALLAFSACRKSRTGKAARQRPQMEPTFAITDKNPLGMYVAYHAMQAAYSGYKPEVNRKPFDKYFKEYTRFDYSRKGDVFCIFTRQFFPNEDDVEAISDYVANGNTLLLVSNTFSESFLQKFHLQVKGTFSLQDAATYRLRMGETGLAMKDTARFGGERFRYFFYPLLGTVQREESYPVQYILKNDSNLPGAVVFRHGSGRIITVTNATAFTNYFLLTRNNFRYLEYLLSYLPDEINSITWDSYYNSQMHQRSNEDFSPFQELMRNPAMRWAFWLLLLLALTWIINGAIRRQRAIAVVKPNSNTSVEFAQTIARLYLLKKDNKNIALKMITFFLDFVRSRYYMSTGKLDNEFAQLLATKSGQPLTGAEALLQTIARIKLRDHISDTELLELNGQLRQFMGG